MKLFPTATTSTTSTTDIAMPFTMATGTNTRGRYPRIADYGPENTPPVAAWFA